MTKKIKVVLPVSLLILFGVTGCGSATGWVEHEGRVVHLPDGSSVLCVVVSSEANGSTSVDCNWK